MKLWGRFVLGHMKRNRFILAALAVGVTPCLFASGPVGIYGIVEKVVLEPSEKAPERIEIWGAFAFYDGRRYSVTEAKRGYLYFKFPQSAEDVTKTALRR